VLIFKSEPFLFVYRVSSSKFNLKRLYYMKYILLSGLNQVLKFWVAIVLWSIQQFAHASTSFLQPMGSIAEDQKWYFYGVIGISLLAIMPVYLALPIILRRYRYGHSKSSYQPDWQFSRVLEICMWGFPVIICLWISFHIWQSAHQHDEYAPMNQNSICIDVIGLNWKWLFIYPEHNIVSVNELVIPVNQSVFIRLTTDTVMQSFRISALAGQAYAMPGMQTQLQLIATQQGTARGENTQFSGEFFADQHFKVKAVLDATWQQWHTIENKSDFTENEYNHLSKNSIVEPATYQLAVPNLFERVVSRYHQHEKLQSIHQPGTTIYQSGELPNFIPSMARPSNQRQNTACEPT